MMKATTNYILSFLLYHDESLIKLVGYTSNPKEYKKYRLVIHPSSFFDEGTYGTAASEPTLPLSQLEDMPILYGTGVVEQVENTLVVHADLVASTYFFLSRYEEYLHPDGYRDLHGRYMGRHSLPARGGFLHRPIIEEYAAFLRRSLQQMGVTVTEPPQQFQNILLTHDVDTLTHFRRLRGAIGGLKRGFDKGSYGWGTIMRAWGKLEQDPAYTFPWLIAQDRRVDNAHILFFVKAVKHAMGYDYPQYGLQSKDFRQFLQLCDTNHCFLGLHASYAAGERPKLIKGEVKRLQKRSHLKIRRVRHHYLRSLQPLDMRALVKAGLTDDFSMGYADVAGFRYGSCRPARFIDPVKQRVTDLTIHPLTAMDASLKREDYMNLTDGEALGYVKQLLDATKRYHGEVVLLWHNTSVEENAPNNQRKLYQAILDYLCQ